MAEIFASGVYGLDESASRFITAGQDETGERFYDVPVRLQSNPMDGLPETLWLRFRDSAEEANLLADRPNVPIEITVHYNAVKR